MPDTRTIVEELPPRLRAVVAPIVRWALGAAVGVLLAAGLGLFAAWHAFVAPGASGHSGVELIGNNFLPGYESSLEGAVCGVGYGFLLGYLCGWTFALVRNSVVWLSIQLVAWRQRAAAGNRVLDDFM